jgi:hypothetical protein
MTKRIRVRMRTRIKYLALSAQNLEKEQEKHYCVRAVRGSILHWLILFDRWYPANSTAVLLY